LMRKYVGSGGLSAIRRWVAPSGGAGGFAIMSRIDREFSEIADWVTWIVELGSIHAVQYPQGELVVIAVSRDANKVAIPSFETNPRTIGPRQTEFEGGS
jgi:hypothetical protein